MTRAARERFFGVVGLARTTAMRRGVSCATTFLLTCGAWIVCRANSLDDAAYIFANLGRDWDFSRIGTPQFLLRQMPVAILAIVALEVGQHARGRVAIRNVVVRLPVFPRWVAYASFGLLVVLFGVYQEAQFIYFQF
jgi:hypothetical protein